jgi:sec-independent protein translocase protein TatA
MFGLGITEIVIILVVVLFVFGPSKLPQLGKGIGEAISGFKNALSEDKKTEKIKKSLSH